MLYPQPITGLGELPASSKMPFGACKWDLPEIMELEVEQRNFEKDTLGSGGVDMSTPFYQTSTAREAGAIVNLHMTCPQFLPIFELEDENGNHIDERDVEPHHNDKKALIDLIIARDTLEYRRTTTHNLEALVQRHDISSGQKRTSSHQIMAPQPRYQINPSIFTSPVISMMF